ncbi:protein of unknown function [Burkholderia multivorans]
MRRSASLARCRQRLRDADVFGHAHVLRTAREIEAERVEIDGLAIIAERVAQHLAALRERRRHDFAEQRRIDVGQLVRRVRNHPHDRGIDLRRRLERLRRHVHHLVHHVAVLQHHRQPGKRLRARLRDHPLDHFVLQHEMLVDDHVGERHQVKQQRARDVVRQVADDAQRRRVARRGERAEVECERVARVQFEQRPEALLQPGDQVAVELDRVEGGFRRRQPFDQRLGQRAEARADLDHALPAHRPDRPDDRIDHALIDEEVLSEALAREMALMLSAVRHRQ